ncbi:HEAT repeat domain-containing protein [Paludisphaera rhizosphaerae]|uniref:hypothetical protein n=1 Tax=Paludisphaera rhizosphaerae TaxID=2711216 RepID=UPI0013EDA5F0|nr:hypothetical protein [Paludisphaera rhizosphaerae]
MDQAHAILRLSSNDRKVAVQAAFDLAHMGGVEAVPDLLRLLSTLPPAGAEALHKLGAFAYALGELKVQAAKPRLIELIRDPRTKGHRGSFLYAMLDLDCRDDYDFLYELVFDDYFEVRAKAVMILNGIIPLQDVEKLVASRDDLLERLEGVPLDDERSIHLCSLVDLLDAELEDWAQ